MAKLNGHFVLYANIFNFGSTYIPTINWAQCLNRADENAGAVSSGGSCVVAGKFV